MLPRITIFYLCLMSSLLSSRASAQKRDTIIVHFDVGRASMSPESDSILDAWFQNGKLIIFVNIFGYCDYTGSAAYNERLSLNRAKTVRDFLRSKLDTITIGSVRGFGFRNPIGDNGTEKGRALNRKVMIVAGIAIKPDTAKQIYNAITDSATRKGTRITLNDVVFYGGRHQPLPTSYTPLNELLRALQDNVHLRIRIEGHVCCTADNTDGGDMETGRYDLSVQRAKFVYDFLVEKGITKKRLSYIGLGGSHKLYPEEDNAFQQQGNRRVVIVIVSN